jgi:hypothetical protein
LVDSFLAITPGIAVGLVFLAIAILERGYRTFLEERKIDPTIKFSGAYFLNIVITAGSGSGIMMILSILPSLITQLTEADSVVITLFSLTSQAILGYTAGYTILDKLNTRVETRAALAEAEKTTTT